MKYFLLLFIFLFVFCKTSIAETGEKTLKFRGAEILIPYKYQRFTILDEYYPSRTCVIISKKPYKALACFRAGEEFSETFSERGFRDRDPEHSSKKLPSGILRFTRFLGVYAIKVSLGTFDTYEADDVCPDTSSTFVEKAGSDFKTGCYVSVIDSSHGVSFSIVSEYNNIETDLDIDKQRESMREIIKSIKILKGVPIKKSTKEKVDFKPSFDCAKSRTTVEKTICADEYLSQLDVSLSESYSNLLHYSDDTDKPHADQRAWLKQRNACKTAVCIQTAYEKRITEVCTQYPISGYTKSFHDTESPGHIGPLCSEEVLYEINNIFSLDRGK